MPHDTTPPAAPRWLEYLPIDQLPDALTNPKQHDQPGITSAITQFNFIGAATVDERTGRLIEGHGRRDSLKHMHTHGHTPPEGVTVSDAGMWLAPVIRGWSSHDDDHATAAGIALNRHTETGGWDETELAGVLERLTATSPELSAAAGFPPGDLDDLIAGWEEQPRGPGDFHAGSDAPPPPGPEPSMSASEGNNVQIKPSLEERGDLYQHHEHRQIIMSYTGQRYVWVIDMLSMLSVTYGVETNSDVLLKLIEAATNEQPPTV